MAEDATSELSEQAIVCDQVLYSTRSLLKNQLRRRALARPSAYTRLCDCREAEGPDTSTLDRLPRFRFGGNRGTNSKVRDKKDNEQRLREITDRLKRGPVPPPRTKHVLNKAQETSSSCALPTRSASFSQVDYSADDNKYVRRRPQATPHNSSSYSSDCGSLPRAKTNSQNPNKSPDVNNIYDETPEENDNEKNEDPPPVITPTPEESEKLKAEEKKRDKSRRRKGMYISQWPDDGEIDDSIIINQFQDCDFMCNETPSPPKLQIINSENTLPDDSNTAPTSPDDTQSLEWPNQDNPDKSDMKKTLLRVNSFSESESDQVDRRSDVSDTESRTNVDFVSPHITRRYSKRPLRGPYGQMLEAEMKKPETGRKNQYSDLKFLDDLKSDATNLG
ncbi:hypothetical protein AMK59_3251 [Oryctes borbonicus]|uniref:Uncharacterized protein n=1 Tax=Oryctes borbonicus TaxID=1629725 RepID=A0A0T6B7Q9_9SCAR|nr:hypothetical protein AMK59_3251 [Oryctes borbonicus]